MISKSRKRFSETFLLRPLDETLLKQFEVYRMDLAKVMSVTGLENGHVDQGLGRLEMSCDSKNKTSLWN